MKRTGTSIAVLACLSAASCASTSGSADSAPPEASASAAPASSFEATDLAGTWVGPCFPSPQGDGSFNQLTFRMTEADWDLDYVAFGDAECTAKFLTVNIKGPYSLGEASAAGEGAREGTFGFTSKTVTAHVDGAVGVINGVCGVTDTAVDSPVDISGGCAGLGAYPIADCAADNDIVMVKDNVLHFGQRPADNNMCTPDKRPTTFEGGAAVTKM